MRRMRENEQSIQQQLPLNPPVFHILLALAEGESHGYAIMQEVRERSGGSINLGPGTLYYSIKRMVANGLIEETEERPAAESDDERRRYYRVTDFGRAVAEAESQRLAELVELARAKHYLKVR